MKAQIILLLSLLTSCATYDRCHTKFATVHSDTLHVVDTSYQFIAGDTIYSSIHDSIKYVYKETERTRLEVHRDSVFTYITCEAKGDTLMRVDTVKVVNNQIEFRDKPSKYKWWHYVILGVFIGLVLIVLIKR